jgi:hypothetical protein
MSCEGQWLHAEVRSLGAGCVALWRRLFACLKAFKNESNANYCPRQLSIGFWAVGSNSPTPFGISQFRGSRIPNFRTQWTCAPLCWGLRLNSAALNGRINPGLRLGRLAL